MIWPALTSTTPGRLRIASAVLVLLGLAVGALGFLTYTARAADLRAAKADTNQLVRLQQIRTDLVAADAIATNAFLVGGLEPDGARAQYLARIRDAGTLMVQARAAADDADGKVLAEANAALTDYTGLIESARANNRQGFPVGIGYLKNASAVLRAEVLDPLARLTAADADRIPSTLNSVGLDVLAAVLLVVVIAVGLGFQVWLKRVTRRFLNLGLAAASSVLVLSLLAASGVFLADRSALDRLQSGSYAAVVDISKARIAAYDAKANESLTLISRGNGAGYEAAWRSASSVALGAAARVGGHPELARHLSAYNYVHAVIRADDDRGQWDQAVSRATSTTVPGNATQAFNLFDAASESALNEQVADVNRQYGAPVTAVGLLAYLLLVAGAAAAILSTIGLNARIKEYK